MSTYTRAFIIGHAVCSPFFNGPRSCEDSNAGRDCGFGDCAFSSSVKQERDPFTDLRRGQSIFDKSMNHDVHGFCLFTPIKDSFCLFPPLLRQGFCLFTPLLRQGFCLFTPLFVTKFLPFHTRLETKFCPFTPV